MRVQRERPPEPAAGDVRMAEAALDHPAVEELQGVLGSEPQGELRVTEGLRALPVSGQSPREDVVAVDRRAFALADTREVERVSEADPVVDFEEADLEVGADA